MMNKEEKGFLLKTGYDYYVYLDNIGTKIKIDERNFPKSLRKYSHSIVSLAVAHYVASGKQSVYIDEESFKEIKRSIGDKG